MKFLRKKSTSSLGFTLLELLVVFSVIGILTTVGFASFNGYSKKQTLDQAVLDLKTGIDQTKFNAISRIKPATTPCDSSALDRYRLRIGIGQDLYDVDAGCSSGAGVQFTQVLSSKQRASDLDVSIPPGECGSSGYLQFSVLSGTVNTCRIVIFQNGGGSKTICVDSGGNSSVLDGNSSCPFTAPTPTITPTPTTVPTSAPTPTPGGNPKALTTSLRTEVLAAGVSSGNSLVLYLNSAITYFGFNTPIWNANACNQLKSFKGALPGSVIAGIITQGNADTWTAETNSIRSTVPCVAPN